MKSDDYVEMSATYFCESFRMALVESDGREEWWQNDPKARSHILGKDGVLDRVVRSQKFHFGLERCFRDAESLSGTAKNFFSNGIGIMPFSECYLEWDLSCKNYSGDWDNYPHGGVWDDHHSKRVCIIWRDANVIKLQQFGGGLGCRRDDVLRTWWFSGWIMILGYDGSVTWESCQSAPSPADSSGRNGPPWIGPCPSDFDSMEKGLACLAMLLARETKIVEKHPPSGLNAHRIKKGRVPLFSHKVVTIDPQRIVYEGGSQPSGIKRASPRLHWRRGHVRTLSSGKVIGIPPSIIGAAQPGLPGGGILDKTYRVRPQTEDRHDPR